MVMNFELPETISQPIDQRNTGHAYEFAVFIFISVLIHKYVNGFNLPTFPYQNKNSHLRRAATIILLPREGKLNIPIKFAIFTCK